jgi:hypothetical protein
MGNFDFLAWPIPPEGRWLQSAPTHVPTHDMSRVSDMAKMCSFNLPIVRIVHSRVPCKPLQSKLRIKNLARRFDSFRINMPVEQRPSSLQQDRMHDKLRLSFS